MMHTLHIHFYANLWWPLFYRNNVVQSGMFWIRGGWTSFNAFKMIIVAHYVSDSSVYYVKLSFMNEKMSATGGYVFAGG